MSTYTRRELMVACAAAQIADGEVVFVGMRLPLLAFATAVLTHAPDATGFFENGVVRDTPPDGMVVTMSDTPNLAGALASGRMGMVMNPLAAGRVAAGFLGGAQIDRFGNLNTTFVRPDVRLPGSGGACDIASAARRLLVIMPHQPRRFVSKVDHLTSPGYGDGAGWRCRVGLPPLESVTVITTRAIMRRTEHSDGFSLLSVHPGESADAVLADTGWEWVDSAPETTAEPAPEVLAAIRRLDPTGFWTSDS
ncbi:CoA-transferase subunit beta [Fodinicola acaciae]|uniref:CoA-transferase subunit beta n=1 Tax=Fodinicola acaciae TaxID=2681555 RepID=UPI001C9E70FC|nr:CoA-transferase [Fodinicola acaciae]